MAAETKSSFYRYIVKTCAILIPKKDPIQLDNPNILGFFIEKDFDNNYFPIFGIQLNLTFNQYYSIIENKENLKIKIRLEKVICDETSTSKFTEVEFDDIFTAFISDDTSFLDKENYEKAMKTLGSAENRGSYEFYLFKDSDITASKKVFNRVISKANLATCITYLLSKSGSKNLLMTQLDNNNLYTDIILPPLSIIQSINYLEKCYGFYENGTIFFYDFDVIYFINRKSDCTAYRNGEYKNVIINIFKATNPNAKTPGTYKDTKTKTYILHVGKDNISMRTDSLINDQITGTNVTIIDTKNNTSSTVKPDVRTKNSNTSYISDNFNNKYIPKMIENSKYENDHIVNIAFNDIDIGCLTPNKKFNLTFEDKEFHNNHSGYYRLSKYISVFSKQGEYYSTKGTAVLKKTK